MILDELGPSTVERTGVEGSDMVRRDLTTNEVAVKLREAGIRGGSRPTIIRWTDSGFIPHYRTFGGGYRMYRPEVINLLVQLWRSGVNRDDEPGKWLEKVSEQLFELHDKLAERDRQQYDFTQEASNSEEEVH
jgi:excisionase family DNA binding protein